MSDGYEAVLNHLLFHKALLSDDEGGERITRYLAMVREIEQGMHLAVRDPLEKSIAAAFELVLEHQLDPWDINLGEFTRLYMDKVKEDGYVNFVTAGKLVLMAWSILKLQSEEVLTNAEPVERVESFFSDWDLGVDLYQEPEDFDFTQAVVRGKGAPLRPAIRRQGRRAVTLMELMDAFDEARREAELALQLQAIRERAAPQGNRLREKLHGEDLSEDIGMTWSRIVQLNGGPIRLQDLTTDDPWDWVTVFVSVLFLAKMEKIKVWQRNFPFGAILVRRLSPDTTLQGEELEDVAAMAEEQAEATA
jgi:segregation and condensation protein A